MELLRMKDKQFKSAKALIHNICCNYDRTTGGCLVLDRGEVVKCPQLITQSVSCKHFKDVLLEDRDAKLLKAQIYQDQNVKRCEVCGEPFQALSNRAKYCARCTMEIRRKQASERKRKQRGIEFNVTH